MRVSSSSSDPASYLNAKSQLDRSSDLSASEGAVDQGISVADAALKGMNTVEGLLKQAENLAKSALTSDEGRRAELAKQYDDLRKEIDSTASDSSYQGVNLLKGGSSYSVLLNDKAGAKLELRGSELSSDGLGVAAASNGWASTDDIKAALKDLVGSTQAESTVSSILNTDMPAAAYSVDAINADRGGALQAVRAAAVGMGSNRFTLQNRRDTMSSYSSALQQDVSSKLNADMGEEGASTLAAQSRAQLGIQSLSFAGQQEQALMQLFR